jgi:hypothetical protein
MLLVIMLLKSVKEIELICCIVETVYSGIYLITDFCIFVTHFLYHIN